MPVLILAGDEEFEMGRRIAELKATLVHHDWQSTTFVRLTNPGVSEIVEAAANLPFGAGNRLVLVDRCQLFTKRKTRGPNTKGSIDADVKTKRSKASKDDETRALETFTSALASVYERTYLVFACPFNFDATLKISKSLAGLATIENFSKEKYSPGAKNARLESWCRKEAKRFGATIDDQAIEYLLEGTEAELRQISSEIRKAAIANLPKHHITRELVVELSPHQSHVFTFADHWLNNQLPEALLSLKELHSQQSAMATLAAVQTLMSKWIKIKLLSENFNQLAPLSPKGRMELPLPDLAKKVASQLKAMPFAIERDLKRLAKQTSDQLIAKRIELARLEWLIKSGEIPDKHALNLFVLK